MNRYQVRLGVSQLMRPPKRKALLAKTEWKDAITLGYPKR